MAIGKRILIVVLLVVTMPGLAGVAPDNTLISALRSYRSRGLDIVFSSALVRSDMRVVTKPNAELPLEAQVQALLFPHGLALERHDANTWVVVRALRAPTASANPLDAPRDGIPEEVRITASRYRLQRATSSTALFDRQQLDAIPAVGTDALRKVSALPGSATLGVSARQRLRGGDEDETLFLVDGVEVVEPFHLKDFHALFGAISDGAIDRVDVYTGGFPVTYDGRLSGVVDLTLGRRDADEAYEVDLNPLAVGVTASATKAAGLDWLFAARRGLLDEVAKVVEGDPGRPMFHDELLRLAHVNETDEVRLGIMNVEDEVQLTKDEDEETGDSDYNNRLTWLSWRHQWAPNVDTDTTLSQTTIANDRSGVLSDSNDALGALEDSRDISIWRLRSIGNIELSTDLSLSVGVDMSSQEVDFTADLAATYGPLGAPLGKQTPLIRSLVVDRTDTFVGTFIASRVSMFDERLSIDLGLRFDDQDAGAIHDDQWSQRLGVWVRVNSNFDLYANIGRFVQQQNTFELQLDDGEIEVQDAQRSNQLLFGLAWRPMPSTQWQVEWYEKKINSPRPRFTNLYDPYVLLPELHADRVELFPTEARNYGIETKLTKHAQVIDLWASYTWSHAEEQIGGDWRPRPWDQRHAVRFGASRALGAYRFSASVAWHSGWPRTDRIDDALTADSLYSDRFADYSSVDFRIARRFDSGPVRVDVYLDVVNTFNRQNEGGIDYDLVGTSWVGDPANLVPLIPTLGVRAAW